MKGFAGFAGMGNAWLVLVSFLCWVQAPIVHSNNVCDIYLPVDDDRYCIYWRIDPNESSLLKAYLTLYTSIESQNWESINGGWFRQRLSKTPVSKSGTSSFISTKLIARHYQVKHTPSSMHFQIFAPIVKPTLDKTKLYLYGHHPKHIIFTRPDTWPFNVNSKFGYYQEGVVSVQAFANFLSDSLTPGFIASSAAPVLPCPPMRRNINRQKREHEARLLLALKNPKDTRIQRHSLAMLVSEDDVARQLLELRRGSNPVASSNLELLSRVSAVQSFMPASNPLDTENASQSFSQFMPTMPLAPLRMQADDPNVSIEQTLDEIESIIPRLPSDFHFSFRGLN